jgi:hypothetical protein
MLSINQQEVIDGPSHFINQAHPQIFVEAQDEIEYDLILSLDREDKAKTSYSSDCVLIKQSSFYFSLDNNHNNEQLIIPNTLNNN